MKPVPFPDVIKLAEELNIFQFFLVDRTFSSL